MKIKAEARRQFASDNWAGICPEACAALTEANAGHAAAYGDDAWTAKAVRLVRELFETQCEVFFVFNGTAANSLALAAVCQSYHSILCHQDAHVEEGESGAPEFFTNGSKLILLPGANGKIGPAAVEAAVRKRMDVHFPKARVVSLTQSTEAGTVYSVKEVRAVSAKARELGLLVHMDGARFANAVASLRVKPKDITWRAGVDVLSFGGSKNGMPAGEAVVFFNRELAREFGHRRKQAGQLASKMRFLSAPWAGMLRDGAWLRHAAHANAMAKRLAAALRGVPGVRPAFPCQANGVFVRMPEAMRRGLLARGWKFHLHGGPDVCRLMCSWDTAREDVDAFAAEAGKLARGK